MAEAAPCMVHGKMDPHNHGGVIVPLHFMMMWVKFGLSQTLREDLRAAHRWPTRTSPRGCQAPKQKQTQLDRLYQRVSDDLDKLIAQVGLKVAA